MGSQNYPIWDNKFLKTECTNDINNIISLSSTDKARLKKFRKKNKKHTNKNIFKCFLFDKIKLTPSRFNYIKFLSLVRCTNHRT